MPAPAIILGALSLITGLIGTLTGTGVTIHSAIQSEKAADLGQEVMDQGEDNLVASKAATRLSSVRK